MKLANFYENVAIDVVGAGINLTQLERNKKVSKEEILDINGNVNLSKNYFKKIPYKFGKVSYEFSLEDCLHLETLENCPDECDTLVLKNNVNLTSLDFSPKKCHTYCITNLEISNLQGITPNISVLILNDNKNLTSLHNINKYVSSCNQLLISCKYINESILSVLLINDLTKIIITDAVRTTSSSQPKKKIRYASDAQKALEIVAKYVGQGKKGMMLAHTELLEKRLDKFAKI